MFIYALVDPRSDQIRYVGKSVDPDGRLRSHVCVARGDSQTHVSRWIRQVLADGCRPRVEVLQTVTAETWQEGERFWHRELTRAGLRLTNQAPCGGGGLPGPNLKLRGRPSPKRGITLSPEHREKLSRAKRGIPTGRATMKGRTHTAEARRKIGDAQRGRPKSARHRAAISEALKRRGAVA